MLISSGAFANGSATSGQGSLLIIGSGQVGTQATVIDNSNAIINNATIVINNTGAFLQQTGGDAMGGFILNGGTLTIQDLPALEALSLFNAEYLHLDYRTDRPQDVEREGV